MIQYQNEHVTVFQSALFQTTSTVIQTKEMVLIVDPNWLPNEVAAIQNYVHAIKGERETYLLFTHGDFDHIIGYQAFPDATTIGSLELQNHPKKEHKLKLIRDFDNQNYITRNYPIQFPELDIVVQEDGQQLQLGETTLTFYHAPGHTADGLMTVVEPLGIWIAGDYVSDFELPFIYQSAKAYSQTLEKCCMMLEKHSIQLLIPGHGLATSEHKEMKRRLEMASDYLKRLRQSVIANDEPALEALYQEHAFLSSFTEECHKENVSIMKREYL
ncbi:MBL fold metallo-hydrolase [Paenibacillus aceris]|uniref:Glyoxylase-like metal-dependent hydrolase (Beta-lactamase superfamily II) n=1 Tax=Paenibacillus aceris TaxID=869555 RepID=A0ABS4I0J0_9BACL|nr:MBL fold metallo-hydrolase [Paenibacillus aceris]MBP1964405.1 glyoxylase-like metal-dependent hydrolase (beta-lactamase superfamily II) [Paenibacillus aceris]NHW35880.1 MBL fold metallo-hydrolase [Paenibacillus aceris]